MNEYLEMVQPYLPYVLSALPFVLGLIALAVQGRLDGFLRETVAAVYRVAIHAANELQDSGLEWLKSEDGIAFRKELASAAYDYIPGRVGPVPVAPVVRALISREQFCALVESAFQEIAELAERLELAEELPESYLGD